MPAYQKGDLIKVEFPDEATGVSEWMWVRVDYCDIEKQLMFGTLDSIPLDATGNRLKIGTELAISIEKIREHKKLFDFDGHVLNPSHES